MAENDFYELQGNSYRGSRYSNFAGGGVDPQGNVSSAVTENAANAVGTSIDAPADAPPTPIEGLSEGLAEPSYISGAIGASLPFAGKEIGQAAGEAIGAGATYGEAAKEGVSSLAGKVSGGLIGNTGASATATNAALGSRGASFGPATKNAVTTATGGSVNKLGSFSNIGAGVGAGFASAAAVLLAGGDFKTAAKTGVGTAVGTVIGTAIAGPIGGFIGGTLGSALGGRVICTQLVKDGLLKKEDQLLDMEFTFHSLSNIHVRGYLFWARNWVKRMQRSKKITKATLKIVEWRLNEIKYQLGMRDKPDYRGKIVRLVMENFCFIIGVFLKDTEETLIYRKDVHHERYAT